MEPLEAARGGDAPRQPEAKKKGKKAEKEKEKEKDLKDGKEGKEGKKEVKTGKKGKKKGWDAADELDDRQKHDLGLLFRPERRKVKSEQREELEPAVEEILEKLELSSSSPWQRLQEAVQLQSQQLELQEADGERHAKASEEALSSARTRLAELEEAQRACELRRAEAERRAEELELKHLEMSKVEAEAKVQSPQGLQGQGEERLKELEKLLKDAFRQGAKLSRAKKELEEQRSQQSSQISKLQRRVERLEQEVDEQTKARAKQAQRHERLQEKLRRQQDLVEDLEQSLESSETRCERLELRLAETLRLAASGEEAAPLKAHVEHLARAARELETKVEEQEEIIDVLRRLLQNHKDFIRDELGSDLALPEGSEVMVTTKI